MKKLWCTVLLAALLSAMVVAPVSAGKISSAAIPQSLRDDMLEAAQTVCRCFEGGRVDALPAVDMVTVEDKGRVSEVKTALEALPNEQQALITQEKREKLSALMALQSSIGLLRLTDP